MITITPLLVLWKYHFTIAFGLVSWTNIPTIYSRFIENELIEYIAVDYHFINLPYTRATVARYCRYMGLLYMALWQPKVFIMCRLDAFNISVMPNADTRARSIWYYSMRHWFLFMVNFDSALLLFITRHSNDKRLIVLVYSAIIYNYFSLSNKQ